MNIKVLTQAASEVSDSEIEAYVVMLCRTDRANAKDVVQATREVFPGLAETRLKRCILVVAEKLKAQGDYVF